MDLNEAKEILKANGYILEDTDDWDEADMPAGMTQKNRAEMVKRHNGRNWYSSAGVDAMANKHDDLEDKIEQAQDFNVDNRIENSSGFGTAIKNVYGKTILAELKKKALKRGFDKDYIDSVEETMLHDDKIFDTASDFIEDVTDENYDLERLNVNQLLKKYGDKALKYVLKEIFNYYYEA